MTGPSEGLTTARAQQLAAELWGLESEATRLGGWEDSNFLLRATTGNA